jgi:hypothetical protein
MLKSHVCHNTWFVKAAWNMYGWTFIFPIAIVSAGFVWIANIYQVFAALGMSYSANSIERWPINLALSIVQWRQAHVPASVSLCMTKFSPIACWITWEQITQGLQYRAFSDILKEDLGILGHDPPKPALYLFG